MVGSAPRAGWERRRQELRQQGRLYRLDLPVSTPTGLLAGLNENYVHDPAFAVDPISVGDCEGLIIRGVTGLQAPEWCDAVTVLTGFSADVSASSAGCALLLGIDGEAYAVVYGPLGHRLIDQDKTETAFGLSYASRMSSRPMIDGTIHAALRTSNTADIDAFGEIVPLLTSKLAGQPVPLGDGRTAYLAGVDALVLPPVADPRVLLADIRAVSQTCRAGAPYPELDFIRHLAPLAADSPLIAALDEQLEALLGGQIPQAPSSWRHHLSLTPPHGEQDDASCRYELAVGAGKSEATDQVRVGSLVERLREVPLGERRTALTNGTIGTVRVADGRQERHRADQWLTAEVALKEFRYLYYGGRWHQIGSGFLTFLQQAVSATFSGVLAAPDGLSTAAQLHLYRMAAVHGLLTAGTGSTAASPIRLNSTSRIDADETTAERQRPAVA